jgi:hypothetical protein
MYASWTRAVGCNVAEPFPVQIFLGETVQFAVNQWNQFVRAASFPLLHANSSSETCEARASLGPSQIFTRIRRVPRTEVTPLRNFSCGMRDFGKFLRLMNATRHRRDTDEEGSRHRLLRIPKGPTFAMERATAPWAIAGLGRLRAWFRRPRPCEGESIPAAHSTECFVPAAPALSRLTKKEWRL